MINEKGELQNLQYALISCVFFKTPEYSPRPSCFLHSFVTNYLHLFSLLTILVYNLRRLVLARKLFIYYLVHRIWRITARKCV